MKNCDPNYFCHHDKNLNNMCKVVKQWLLPQNIPLLKWSDETSDMNLIENFWNKLDKKCAELIIFKFSRTFRKKAKTVEKTYHRQSSIVH